MIPLYAQPVVEQLQKDLRERIGQFKTKTGRSPGLAVVIVGEDPASVIYTKKKRETALAVGMQSEVLRLPATSTPMEVRALIERLNADPKTDGILIQRPLPAQFIEEDVVYWVHPDKDVDAFHPENTGRLVLGLPCFRPCTPAGVMEILKHYNVDPAGKIACVMGRSSIVGKPMASLLLQANATVLQCHSRTPNLRAMTSQADILVVAIGKPHAVDRTYVKTGAVVIDVGIHRNAENKVVGDCDYNDISKHAYMATPVPGGVGPMTITILLQNTMMAAERLLPS
ncbi:bifunctional 5,10-methylenetetrahydrofolate dehydrogenase/5,10-methenyltetrahydrofolate cyclohydrolase [Bdellovibrionota bacterium FG-1]